MVEVTELQDSNGKKSTANNDYLGPGDDFPFMAFHIMGAAHILVATGMLVLGVMHVSLAQDDREFFLLTGGVSLWCPLAALATGILGAVLNANRHWEVACIKNAFLAMNVVTAFVFMLPLALVTGLVGFKYYDITTFGFAEFKESAYDGEENRVVFMWLIVAVACLEFLICILSASICCCCSPLYMEADTPSEGAAAQEQIVIRQQAAPPVYVEKPQKPTIIVQKQVQPKPQPIILQAPPQPAPAASAPIIIQAPPLQFRSSAQPMIMPTTAPPPPPPQPIYVPSVRRPLGGKRRFPPI